MALIMIFADQHAVICISTSQFSNSNTAVDNTVNTVLVSGSTVQLTEYAAEQNHHTSCSDGQKGNGTGSWPCTADGPCTGETYNGHGQEISQVVLRVGLQD